MALKIQTNPIKDRINDKTAMRRETAAELVDVGRKTCSPRNDLLPSIPKEDRSPDELKLPDRRVRKQDPVQLEKVKRSIQTFGFVAPIQIRADGTIIDGATRWEAAKALGLATMPCIVVDHLTEAELRLLRLTLNRLAESGGWEIPELELELQELIVLDLPPLEVSGFATAEIDALTLANEPEAGSDDVVPEVASQTITRLGDSWRLGKHRLVCGDGRSPDVYKQLMDGETAQLLLTDVPYNVKISGHVTSADHRDFAMASGEMTDAEFEAFNSAWMGAALPFLANGGLLATSIDWRNLHIVHTAAVGLKLELLNLIVWAKTNAGMGSLYRSQHELIPLFKKGNAPHRNNVQLGATGRWRSNVWTYPGASSLGSDARDGLKDHPTVKPVAMLVDALLDITNAEDIVIEPFCGSGSTLMAAQKTQRRCRAIELDPIYVDVAVLRWMAATGQEAIHEETGKTFSELAAEREAERPADDVAVDGAPRPVVTVPASTTNQEAV